MEKPSSYWTLKEVSEGLYKEKGSKFIGIAQACYSEEEAKNLLTEWRKTHHQARHLCYAYRFGVDQPIWRANDDGEPSNSAGPPILGQIEAFDLHNVLIGVVRYYGGTKLGVGGLINAYRTAAKEALLHGEIVEREVFEYFELNFEYEDMPHIMNALKQLGLEILESDFALACSLQTRVPRNASDRIQEAFSKFASLKVESKGIY